MPSPALWHRGDDAELVRLAIEQGRPTHGHPRSGVTCALYCLLARRLLEGEIAEADALAEGLSEFLDDDERTELDVLMTAPQRTHPAGTGYVVDTFRSAWPASDSGLRASRRTGKTSCAGGTGSKVCWRG
ncbi:ADP-ribosylglycohydrolase family protein [Methylococcus geothermalis]|uniref:Uncharacterized protein n=1 Tax=Methylococcus geothermalis TaxID=2681310 RepID=A0A858QBN1_9GAMM|nr:ADP-ribosylglycohydrolase family protein [Methylococcus geothermalis]QJD31106.1 hypothetical protein GNH96_14935 [Methylococcus geothermalis]